MDQKYLFVCHCGGKTAVEPSQAGQRLHCECGAEHTLPTMLEIVRLEPEPCSNPPPPAVPWAERQRILFVGAVLFVVGLAMAGMVGWHWPPAPLVLTPERIRTRIDSLTVVQTFREWADLAHGLENRPRREVQLYQEQVAWDRRWLYVAGVIALAGLATMGAGLLTRPARQN